MLVSVTVRTEFAVTSKVLAKRRLRIAAFAKPARLPCRPWVAMAAG